MKARITIKALADLHNAQLNKAGCCETSPELAGKAIEGMEAACKWKAETIKNKVNPNRFTIGRVANTVERDLAGKKRKVVRSKPVAHDRKWAKSFIQKHNLTAADVKLIASLL